LNKKTRNVTWFLNYNILQKNKKTTLLSKKKRETYWMELLNKLKRQTFRVLFCCHMVSFLLERKTKDKDQTAIRNICLMLLGLKKLKKVKLTSNIYARFWLPIIKIQKKTKKTRYYLNLMKSG